MITTNCIEIRVSKENAARNPVREPVRTTNVKSVPARDNRKRKHNPQITRLAHLVKSTQTNWKQTITTLDNYTPGTRVYCRGN